MAIRPVKLSQISNIYQAMKRELPVAAIKLAEHLNAKPKGNK